MSQRSPITTHILDTSSGRPAAGVAVSLSHQQSDGAWAELASSETDADGRIGDLLPVGQLAIGSYRLCFDTGSYFSGQSQPIFYPSVTIDFLIAASGEHYHVPLLLSPFGYSTYRGS